MSERIITLFGEEVVPEQLKAVGRSRAKKKTNEPGSEDGVDNPAATTAAVAPQLSLTDAIVMEQRLVAPQNEEVTDEPATTADLAHDATETGSEPGSQTEAGQREEDQPGELANQRSEPMREAGAAATADDGDDTPIHSGKKGKGIVLPEDWNGEKQYYSIGEVADLFQVKTSNIRFWTNDFKLKVRTTRKGDRLYTPDQIRELRTIHHLVKERGFTLAGAKGKLSEANNMQVETIDLKKSLLLLRNKLMAIKNQL